MKKIFILSLALLFPPGCASLQRLFGWQPAEGGASATPAPGPLQVAVEWQRPAYEGRTLSGRLLVGVREGRLTLDKRLLPGVSVNIASVSDCATGQPAEYLETDSFPKPPGPEQLLTLEPGQWYGVDLRLPLFDEQLNGQRGPDCIEAELVLRSASDEPFARLHVRQAQPTPPAPPAPPTPSPTDAGTP